MPRLFVVLAIVLWNAAFVAAPHVGTWPAIGLAGAVLLVLAARLAPGWRSLLAISPRAIALGVVAGLLHAGITELAYPLLASVPAIAGAAGGLRALLGAPRAFEWCLVLPFVVLSEECAFRGALLDEASRGRSHGRAILLAASLYAFAHVASGNLLLVAVAALCGAFWCALRVGAKSLWAPLVAHLVWDWIVLAVAPVVRP